MTLPGWHPSDQPSDALSEYVGEDFLSVQGNVGRATLHVEVHGDSTRDAARRLLQLRQIIREFAADPRKQARQPEIPAAVRERVEAMRSMSGHHATDCERMIFCDEADAPPCWWHKDHTEECPSCTCLVQKVRDLLQAVDAANV